jgi:hypothetical protein
MNEDYLWDKSGAPDPEIQQLEEILGTLRYQPKPLRLAPRRNYVALLAIAATVAIALLAGGLWLRIKSYDLSIAPVAMDTTAPSTPKIGFLSVAQPAAPKRHPAIRAAKHDNQEAVAAKQQLMFALRLASEKLNDAYRRTQTPTQIKNQHRAG